MLAEKEGWYVVNVKDARWVASPDFGRRCLFEKEGESFSDIGINLMLLEPGKPACRYHRENAQEDFLVLSTIHSAKGQEWDVVFVLNAADGCIPSDMATGSPEQVEEERRLLYVAMTRARDHLHVVHPLRFFVRQQHRHGDRHLYAPRSRFISEPVLARFERRTHASNLASASARAFSTISSS